MLSTVGGPYLTSHSLIPYIFTHSLLGVSAHAHTHTVQYKDHASTRKFRSKRNSLLNSNLALLAFLPSFSGMALDLTKSHLKSLPIENVGLYFFCCKTLSLGLGLEKKKRYWPLIVNLICLTHMQLQIKSFFVQCLGSWGLVGINNK